MNANLTGMPANRVYIYPGSYEDTSTEAITVGDGFSGARGSGSMDPAPNAATVAASGIDVQNVLSQGVVPNFQNLSDSQLAKQTASDGLQIRGVGRSLWNLLACK